MFITLNFSKFDKKLQTFADVELKLSLIILDWGICCAVNAHMFGLQSYYDFLGVQETGISCYIYVCYIILFIIIITILFFIIYY